MDWRELWCAKLMAALSFATADCGRATEVAEPDGPRGHQLRMIGFNHAPVGQDFGHIVLRLGDPRNALDGPNATGTGIIGRKRQIDAPEFTKLPAQITGGAAQIAMQAVAIDPELLCGARHQLAQAERTLWAERHRIVPALLDQHRVHESDRQTGFARSALHKRI